MASRPILLRFESRNGQFRFTVNPQDDFPSLQQKVSIDLRSQPVRCDVCRANLASTSDPRAPTDRYRAIIHHSLESSDRHWWRGETSGCFGGSCHPTSWPQVGFDAHFCQAQCSLRLTDTEISSSSDIKHTPHSRMALPTVSLPSPPSAD